MNDQIQKRELHVVPPEIIQTAAAAALIALALWGAIQAVSALKEFRYIGAGIAAANTISITGEGEVFAVPDIATFSVGVTEEAVDVETAQTAATESMNEIIAFLKGEGIEERDIKTTNYNVYPRYEYNEREIGFPAGERELVGFEVSQTIEVKVRDTARAGEILSGVGSLGATNVSGLSFTIDEDETLQADARELAIADAKAKAEVLADDLGVRLVRVVGFNESGGAQPPMLFRQETLQVGGAMDTAASPTLPTGENKIVSNVTVTYEIR